MVKHSTSKTTDEPAVVEKTKVVPIINVGEIVYYRKVGDEVVYPAIVLRSDDKDADLWIFPAGLDNVASFQASNVTTDESKPHWFTAR